MAIKIVIPSYLQPFASNIETVEVNGSTVGGCLNNLAKRFPDIEKMIFNKNGRLLNYIGIYVNGEDAYPGELVKPVRDGDELHILYLIGGG
jgi:molybdopterin converting factor small subunit